MESKKRRWAPYRTRLCALAALAAIGCTTGITCVKAVRAQTQTPGLKLPQAGTIQVQVRLVPVDVVVTDRLDRPITDLRKEEFHVFEDGREQEIRHFVVQKFTDAAAEAVPKLAPPPVDAAAPPSQTARIFLILMGRGRHHRFKNIDSLLRWLRNDLLPQDRVALFAYNRATDFTVNHEQIAHVLEKYNTVYEDIEAQLESRSSGLSAVYGSKEIPNTLQREIDRIFAGPDALAYRQVPADTGNTIQAKRDNAMAGQILTHQLAVQMAATVMDPGQSLAATPNELAAMDVVTGLIPLDAWAMLNTGTTQDMKNIFTCIEYLRYLEGEKHLLFFTEDGLFFPFGNVDNDDTIAKVANNARVAIDTFQTGGIKLDLGISKGPVNLSGGSLSSPGYGNALSSLRTISQLTGGRSSIYGYLGPALRDVDVSTRCQYLLAYYPKDENWNGEYRQIEVRVTRPGAKVYYRHGYFARDTFRPSDDREFLAYSRITSAGGFEADIRDISFQAAVATVNLPGTPPQIMVNLQIDLSRVGLREIGDRHTGRLRVVIYYADGRRNYLGEEWKNLDLKLLGDTYQRYLKSGVPVSIPLPSKASIHFLKVVIYDTQNDRVGSRLIKFR
jgi:VWFA-related protein